MSGRLDYIHSEVDLELVKYKLEKALQNSQVQNSKKTQRRSRQKVTPDTTQVVTISEKKPSISLLLKQKLFALALFCLVFIIIILAIIIVTTSKEGRKEVRESTVRVTALLAKTSTTVQASTIVQEASQCIKFGEVNVTIINNKHEMLCNKDWIGDEICDDMCNTLEFQFDQGDCCLTSPDSVCIQCQCFCPGVVTHIEPSEIICTTYDFVLSTDLDCPQTWIGDGFCDDDCNHPQSDYDDQDCCTASNVFWDNTCLDCKCYQCLFEHPCYVPPEVPLPLELNCDLMSEDGFCDDLCNHPEQNFDGGDCCLDYIDITYCTECYCYNDCSQHPNENCLEENPNLSNTANCNPLWINDTFCDDACNFPEFNYDEGDCCLDLVSNNFCSHCFCYNDCSFHNGDYSYFELPPGVIILNVTETWLPDTTTTANDEEECYVANPMPMDVTNIDVVCHSGWKGDKICDDACNVPELQFDGGDCCFDEINAEFCSFCFCYQDCNFHPQGDFKKTTTSMIIARPPASTPAPPPDFG